MPKGPNIEGRPRQAINPPPKRGGAPRFEEPKAKGMLWTRGGYPRGKKGSIEKAEMIREEQERKNLATKDVLKVIDAAKRDLGIGADPNSKIATEAPDGNLLITNPEFKREYRPLASEIIEWIESALQEANPAGTLSKDDRNYLSRRLGVAAPGADNPFQGESKRAVNKRMELELLLSSGAQAVEKQLLALQARQIEVGNILKALVKKVAQKHGMENQPTVEFSNGVPEIVGDLKSIVTNNVAPIIRERLARQRGANARPFSPEELALINQWMGVPAAPVSFKPRYAGLAEQTKMLGHLSVSLHAENANRIKTPQEKRMAEELEARRQELDEQEYSLSRLEQEAKEAALAARITALKSLGRFSKDAPNMLRDREDTAQKTLAYVFGPGTSAGAAHESGGARASLEDLSSDEEFQQLKNTMQKILTSFGNMSPSKLLSALTRRGMIARGYLPSELILIATFTPEELAEIDDELVESVVRRMPKNAARRKVWLQSVIKNAAVTANIYDFLITLCGNPDNDTFNNNELKRILRLAGAEAADSPLGIIIKMVLGLSEEPGNLKDLLQIGVYGSPVKSLDNRSAAIDTATAHLTKTWLKPLQTLRPADSVSLPSSELSPNEKTELPSSSSTLEWLRGNGELFNQIRDFLDGSEWQRVLQLKGFDKLETGGKATKDFSMRHCLGNLNELEGINVYSDSEDPSTWFSIGELAAQIESKHKPTRALFDLMMWLERNPDKNVSSIPAQIIDPLRGYYGLVQERLVNNTDTSNEAASALLRDLFTALQLISLLTKFMENEGLDPKNPNHLTFKSSMELVKKLGKKFPQNNANFDVLVPLYIGLPLDEQLKKGVYNNMPDDSVRSMLGFPNAAFNFSGFVLDLLQTTLPQREEAVKLLERALSQPSESATGASSLTGDDVFAA